MPLNNWLLTIAVSGILLLPACGVATEPPSAPTEAPALASVPTLTVEPVEATVPPEAVAPTKAPTETAEPAESVADNTLPTAEPTAQVVDTEVDWLTNEGQTAEGFAYLGNPDAPIVLQDYSDFL